VVAALQIGYKTEELLRNAGDGDKVAYSKVLGILKDIQSKGDAERARQARNPAPPKTPRRRPEPYPGADMVLETRPRPLSELSGRRQIPKLISANGMPFLRFKKPQSIYINRIIQDKADQKQKTSDHIKEIATSIQWAQDEDRWEDLADIRSGSEEPWTKEVWAWKENTFDNVRRIDARAKDISKKMLDIVDQERELFERERKDRKAKTNERTKERKKERKKERESAGDDLGQDSEQHHKSPL